MRARPPELLLTLLMFAGVTTSLNGCEPGGLGGRPGMDVYDLVQRGDALKGQVVTVRGRVAAGVEVAGAAGYRLEGDKGASVLVLAQLMPPIQSETVVTGVLKRSLDISFGGATLQGPSYIDTTSPAEGR